MDITRRRASGTLAELLGSAALSSDVQLRTIGIRRAAERSLAAISPEGRAAAEAYAEGVNAYVATLAQLPLEYRAVEITKFQPWTTLDTVTVAKSITFELSFGLDDIANTVALQSYSAVFGPATGATLFSEDLWRSQPFYLASTVPDASMGAAAPLRATPPGHANGLTIPRLRSAAATSTASATSRSSSSGSVVTSDPVRTSGPCRGAIPSMACRWLPTIRTCSRPPRRPSIRST